MSPELAPKPEVESVKDITEALRERYDATTLEPGIEYIIPVLDQIDNAMDTCGNKNEGLDQHLLGIAVAANKDIFAFVDVSALISPGEGYLPTMVLKTAITRHMPGARAELVGFIENNNMPTTVGRTRENKFSAHTSREHFSITQATDGSITIVDLFSDNGTELFTPVLGSRLGLKEGINQHTDTDNPIDDIDFWSVKSASMRDELEKTIQG